MFILTCRYRTRTLHEYGAWSCDRQVPQPHTWTDARGHMTTCVNPDVRRGGPRLWLQVLLSHNNLGMQIWGFCVIICTRNYTIKTHQLSVVSDLICDWLIQMEETVIDDIISLESSLNDEFLTLIDSGLQLANTVNTHKCFLSTKSSKWLNSDTQDSPDNKTHYCVLLWSSLSQNFILLN